MTTYTPIPFTPRHEPLPVDTRTPAEHTVIADARLALGRVLAQVAYRECREVAMHHYNPAEQLALIVEELDLEIDGVSEIAQEVLDGEV